LDCHCSEKLYIRNQVYNGAGASPIRGKHQCVSSIQKIHIPLKVILTLLKQKALAKDMTLPFARSLEG
jgi:hypothetical protein